MALIFDFISKRVSIDHLNLSIASVLVRVRFPVERDFSVFSFLDKTSEDGS